MLVRMKFPLMEPSLASRVWSGVVGSICSGLTRLFALTGLVLSDVASAFAWLAHVSTWDVAPMLKHSPRWHLGKGTSSKEG